MSSAPSVETLTSRFRGLYHRVARKLHVDASYVSRVARGERRSAEVSAALHAEVERLLHVRSAGLQKLSHGTTRFRYLCNQLTENSGRLLKTQLNTAWLLLEYSALNGDAPQRVRNFDKALRGYRSVRRLHRLLPLSDSDFRELQMALDKFEAALEERSSNSNGRRYRLSAPDEKPISLEG
jgi:hypothetical protein